jgi:hypothetical protein
MMNILRNTAINLNHRNNAHVSHTGQNRDEGKRGQCSWLREPLMVEGTASGTVPSEPGAYLLATG